MSRAKTKPSRTLDLHGNPHLREIRLPGAGGPDTPVAAVTTHESLMERVKKAAKLIKSAKDGTPAAKVVVHTTELPPSVDTLLLNGCTALHTLPASLRLLRLNVSACSALTSLPEPLSCYDLDASSTHLRSLPPGLKVDYRLNLEGCADLEELPANLTVGTLILRGCTSLRRLPEGLSVAFLDLSNCHAFREWPERGELRMGRLRVANCTSLRALPSWLTEISQLDLSGCSAISSLPEGLRVSSWIDVAGTGLTSLPASLNGVEIRWRGVPVDERIAFRPETITTAEVLGEQNVELRRVLLERVGYETFLQEAGAQIQDQDRDPGGERRLLRIRMPDDEDLVCVAVLCPSTGRQYLLRVPPTMRTCRQAIAWTAGFDNPDDYQPLVET